MSAGAKLEGSCYVGIKQRETMSGESHKKNILVNIL